MKKEEKKQKQMEIQGKYRKVSRYDEKLIEKKEVIIITTIIFVFVIFIILSGPGLSFFLN